MTRKEELNLKIKAAEIRKGTLTAVNSIGIGHVGGSLSVCDLLAVLYFKHMDVKPEEPRWEKRDRLVMSKGHAGPAVYSALALKGFFEYDLLKTLNKPYTDFPSHCDMTRTPGIDMTTGSLGQGISCAMGIAMACKADGRDNWVYFVNGDGETQEGQIWEAVLFAGARGLDNVIGFLDYNRLQIDGTIDEICSLGDPAEKYKAFGWHVQTVDGHDVCAIDDAITKAKEIKGKPSMIILNTVKGKGVPEIENKASSHNCNMPDELFNSAVKALDEEISVYRAELSSI